jgi:hypothetical protein
MEDDERPLGREINPNIHAGGWLEEAAASVGRRFWRKYFGKPKDKYVGNIMGIKPLTLVLLSTIGGLRTPSSDAT